VVQHLQRGTLDRAQAYQDAGEPKRLADLPGIVEPLGEVVEELTSEGKMGHLATFPYTVGYARAALETDLFEGVVAYFDLLETEMLDLFPELRRRGAGFIGIRPLMGGLLTDKRIDRAALPAGDRMNGPEWDRAYDQLEEAKRLLGEPDTSWTELALRISLTHPDVVSTVVSINDVGQLEQVLAACDGEYGDVESLNALHEITRRFREEFGVKANASGVPTY